jgi:predicted secreted protein
MLGYAAQVKSRVESVMLAIGRKIARTSIALVIALAGGTCLHAGQIERTQTRLEAELNIPFEIALIANPSTGYAWQINAKSSTGIKRLNIEHAGITPPPCEDGQPIVGARTIESWLVTPLQRGPVRLVFEYGRPGDSTSTAIVHMFTIDVRE